MCVCVCVCRGWWRKGELRRPRRCDTTTTIRGLRSYTPWLRGSKGYFQAQGLAPGGRCTVVRANGLCAQATTRHSGQGRWMGSNSIPRVPPYATSLSLQGEPADIGKRRSRPTRRTRGSGDRVGIPKSSPKGTSSGRRARPTGRAVSSERLVGWDWVVETRGRFLMVLRNNAGSVCR